MNKTKIHRVIEKQSQYEVWRLLSVHIDFLIREQYRAIYLKYSNNIAFSAYPFDAIIDEIKQAIKKAE